MLIVTLTPVVNVAAVPVINKQNELVVWPKLKKSVRKWPSFFLFQTQLFDFFSVSVSVSGLVISRTSAGRTGSWLSSTTSGSTGWEGPTQIRPLVRFHRVYLASATKSTRFISDVAGGLIFKKSWPLLVHLLQSFFLTLSVTSNVMTINMACSRLVD